MLISRFSFKIQLWIAGCLAAAPAILVFGLYVRAMVADVQFSRLERSGANLERSVWPLLKDVAGIGLTPASDDDGRKHIDDLAAAVVGLDPSLNLVAEHRAATEALSKVAWPITKPIEHKSFTGASQLLGSFMRDVADRSNLTLDPDLDTFYLMCSPSASMRQTSGLHEGRISGSS
jgi:hypothetical protein